MERSFFVAVISFCALIGMWLSIITLNLVHAIIIGFKIFEYVDKINKLLSQTKNGKDFNTLLNSTLYTILE